MADSNGEFPTIIGADAKFKGELSFEKGVRIEGAFDGRIESKGSLIVAEGAKVTADINAANVRLEGECKGNVVVTEKLQLMSTAKLEGDLKTTRLEIADGAIFIGNVTVGQSPTGGASTRSSQSSDAATGVLTSRSAPAHPQPPRTRPAQVSTAT